MSAPAPRQRRPLSIFEILNMSFGFFGIQFGWGLQMANMSAIYQFLGAGEEDLAILWLAAPLTGFIVQPIVGYYSDRTWTRLGRRRPYFLVGAILASLSLIAMPNSPSLWMAAGLLWILDASVNISMEPFRAFVGDLLPAQQRKVGFAMQSLLIGAGAVLASYMPTILTEWLRVATGSPDIILTTAEGVERAIQLDSAIPAAVHLSFYIGAALFFTAVLYTILTTKEHPPEDMAAFARMKAEGSGPLHLFREIVEGVRTMPTTMRQLAVVQFFTWFGLFCMFLYFIPGVGTQVFSGQPLGDDLKTLRIERGEEVDRMLGAARAVLEETRIRAGTAEGEAVRLGVAEFIALTARRFGDDAPTPVLAPIERRSPLFTTTTRLLLDREAADDEEEAAVALGTRLDKASLYEIGTRRGGTSFGNYNAVAFGFSFLLLWLVRRYSAKSIHLVSLILGGLGLIAAGAFATMPVITASMVLVGIAWASILSMPYAMLSNSIPGEKMGFYMGVFNFFIVLPQILASLGLGLVMNSLLGGKAMNAVVLGGFSFLIAALALLRVSEEVTETARMDGKEG
jgi:maltose/moltooligosaccharide transporter